MNTSPRGGQAGWAKSAIKPKYRAGNTKQFISVSGIFTARRYASAGICYGISVCLSECVTRVLYQND